LKKESKNIED
jgi:hypothetical protein